MICVRLHRKRTDIFQSPSAGLAQSQDTVAPSLTSSRLTEMLACHLQHLRHTMFCCQCVRGCASLEVYLHENMSEHMNRLIALSPGAAAGKCHGGQVLSSA